MKPHEIDISTLKPVHTSRMMVRWRDLDELGHVNNSVYFTYFEQARIEWWLTAGATLSQQQEGPVVITAECMFKRPIHEIKYGI